LPQYGTNSASAVSVGNVPAFCGLEDVASAPEIVKSVVHADDADTVPIGETDGGLHGLESHRGTEFFVGVPFFGGWETRG